MALRNPNVRRGGGGAESMAGGRGGWDEGLRRMPTEDWEAYLSASRKPKVRMRSGGREIGGGVGTESGMGSSAKVG